MIYLYSYMRSFVHTCKLVNIKQTISWQMVVVNFVALTFSLRILSFFWSINFSYRYVETLWITYKNATTRRRNWSSRALKSLKCLENSSLRDQIWLLYFFERSEKNWCHHQCIKVNQILLFQKSEKQHEYYPKRRLLDKPGGQKHFDL